MRGLIYLDIITLRVIEELELEKAHHIEIYCRSFGYGESCGVGSI